MCGIAGSWGERNVPLVERMLSVLAHRGPDAEGRHSRNNFSLGHRRLAIVDPVGGDQPLVSSPPASNVLVANGEIYNAPALRRDLEPPHRFQTGSDCEAILHEYAVRREDTAALLDGMFAFGVASDDGLYLARDPLGIKPLYYGRSGEALLFASEMKALAGCCETISEFPPGTWYHSETGFIRYYDVPANSPAFSDPAQVIGPLRAALEEAVVKRLMSDVPVGAFLSGGLDSSIVAALARQHLDELHTFAVGFPGTPDLEAASRVATYIGSTHHEYLLQVDEMERSLPEILYHLESYDSDLVHSAVPCYFVSKLAADYVKVVLTGEGADELFAGYDYYQAIPNHLDLHRELRRSVKALHNINLQRVDRMSMAHGLEARVPFLDVSVVDLAQQIAPALKLRASRRRPIEKWVLRVAFEDLLPPDIVWREKEQFDVGTGATPALEVLAERHAVGTAPESKQRSGPAPRSSEERYYKDTLASFFDSPDPVLANVARWGSGWAEPSPRVGRFH